MQALARFENASIILVDLGRTATGQDSHDGLVRVEIVKLRELRARHARLHNVYQWVPNESHRHACITINFFLKRKYHDHLIDASFDDTNPPGTPSPNLRTNKVTDRNADLFHTPRDA